jgi:general secretion pathway protein D
LTHNQNVDFFGTVRRKAGVLLAGLLSVFLLGGCAAQMAYQDAQKLSAEGRVEASLAKYQDAVKLDPENVEFKTAYVKNLEKEITRLLRQGQRQLDAGQRDEAKKTFGRVLALDPDDERAQAGMQMLAREERHAALLREAAADVEQKHFDAADEKLSVVLRENPKNEAARTLLRQVKEKTESVAPQTVPETLLAAAYRKPISIDFKEATFKQIFDVIAQTSGLNILFDKDLKLDQKASIILKDTTVEAAIYYMLMTNHLERQVMDANTLLIYANSADKQNEYQQVVVKTFLLSNAKAATVADTLKTLLKLHEVVADDKLNMLIVRDTPEALRLAEKLIATQDVPEPEVMLEVEVLEVSRDKMLNLGVNWPGSLSLTPLSLSGGASLTLDDLRGISSASTGVTLDPLTINAQKVDTDDDILASPRIRVLNHEKAKIIVGDKVPNITSSIVPSGTSTITSHSITYLDVGMKLDVEPTIYLDNDVAIRIGLEVSSITGTQTLSDGTQAYTIGTRNASTMLRLKDGENQVLAGLINSQDSSSATKVPALGDIPILGRLFGSTKDDKQKTEIVLSITPHVIRNIKRPDAPDAEFLSGTENNLRHRPDFAPRPAPAAAAPQAAPSKADDKKSADAAPAAAPVPAETSAQPKTVVLEPQK